ncbi:MAG: metallophosphoesterase family protein [Balneolaceae bacterium]
MATDKVLAIGDIHGCLETLKALLAKLESYPNHRLIFIGDYIDRGPDSKGVIDFLIKLRENRECIFLRGNHEQMLLDALDKKDSSQFEMWYRNGGDRTLKSYGVRPEDPILPEDHMEFFRSTEIYHDTEHYFFVHAGAPPHQTLKESISAPQNTHNFLWSRAHLGLASTKWEKRVVFGHTPRPEPIQTRDMIGIDTGCVYTMNEYAALTALLLPDEAFIQQKSLEQQV